MNRTVVTFTNAESTLIRDRIFNLERLDPLFKSKLELALESEEDTSIELTEDDLELILDEFLIPDPDDTEEVLSIRKKVQQKLLDFRSQ